MSGGHWNYLSYALAERAQSAGKVWRLMSVLEHELDWGICNDTCYACACNRMAPALEAFFDTQCEDATAAISIARDGGQHQCEACKARA